jgi:hypothetical protein
MWVRLYNTMYFTGMRMEIKMVDAKWKNASEYLYSLLLIVKLLCDVV